MSETFDLTAFIENSNYPRKTVTVYTDVAALDAHEELREKLTNGKLDLTAQESLEAKLDMLKVEIEKSALNFELQGLPFRMAQDIADIFNEETPATDEDVLNLLQRCIQSVTNAQGATTSIPDVDGIQKIRKWLSPSEFSKLISGTVEVNFTAATYEAGIDAGFPVGSADME